MQTILGAGGDIGTPLAKELKDYTDVVRLAARSPRQVNGNDQLFRTDLTVREDVLKAVAGAEVAYLVAGLTYNVKIWEQQWPIVMRNVIDACIEHRCNLVFFDNVYMYDVSAIGNMTEESPINPPSGKGRVRAELVKMLQEAMKQRGLRAVIARSADFYGPGARNGILNLLVTDRIAVGSKPNWQSDIDRVHSFTYTPDAARATAMLGNTDWAYNQVWHLPTSNEKLTGRELIAIASGLAGKKPSAFVLAPWMMKLAGLFSGMIGELYEMQYQNNRDYFFNSEKFNRAFDFIPTPYEDGIRETLAASKK